MSDSTASARVVYYIDGFNLYHGLMEHTKTRGYRWLNLYSLATGHLLPAHTLERVVYFTSVPPWNAAKAARHEKYISALESTGVEIVRGRFQRDEIVCRGHCGQLFSRYVEKLTDVNIATRLLHDGVGSKYDWAYLVSGDADLAPAIRTLRAMAPQCKVRVLFPPRRHSTELTQVSHDNRPLGHRALKPHLFPDVVHVDGRKIVKPETW